MFVLQRTNGRDPDFVSLVKNLDADLARRDGEDHSFYSQFNKIDNINCAVIAYYNGLPVGCGALKPFSREAAEIKRMWVSPDRRRTGVASRILHELEAWAEDLSFSKCVLETGKKQPEALALYSRCGYVQIPNYGPYEGVANSLCFQKVLRAG